MCSRSRSSHRGGSSSSVADFLLDARGQRPRLDQHRPGRGNGRPPCGERVYKLDLTIFCSMLNTPLDLGSTWTFSQCTRNSP